MKMPFGPLGTIPGVNSLLINLLGEEVDGGMTDSTTEGEDDEVLVTIRPLGDDV